ncbi:hypothetical protein IDH44_12320 [Paenibacillus sp. IB182496]|uniref:WYL domain-containing protein n=1 Tax=Paenibacillus sabuli TaxID=2772509 RepID=A0A927BSJ0_9BACL|nr:hypothetical protein [Paenibacillus sabuli]MBD2845981.1 hypothetical protein [Paenibacillus sabuli]
MTTGIEQWTGRVVEMIYLDRKGAFSKRRVRIIAVRDGRVRAYCLRAQAPRLFAAERIMALLPVASHAG